MTRTIMITGATSGIGLALARQYAAAGARLLLLGRRPLAELPGDLFTRSNYCQVDLTNPDCAEKTAEFCAQHAIVQLDLLIHNAGSGFYGDFAGQALAGIDELLAVNLLAPIRLTHALRPQLLAARGRVAFISSAVTAVPTPEYAVYGASKAALEGFARSLRVEWQGEIGVQIIRPGATHTPMHAKLGIPREKMDWEKFPSADTVAAQIAAAIDRGRREATIGLSNKLLTFAGRNGRLLIDPLMQQLAARKGTQHVPAQPHGQAVCVITGAAAGIGRALAFTYGRAGYRIVGIDVDEAAAAITAADLAKAGIPNHFIHTDLGQKSNFAPLVDQLTHSGPIAVLIHNAGISAAGYFAHLDIAAQTRVIELNLLAPLALTAALAQRKMLAESIRLIFLSSLSHYVSYPGAAVYAASKDGLAHYARSLLVALPRGRTLTVFPGPTRTEHARRYSPDNSREENRMPPEQVAAAILRGMENGRCRIIPGSSNQAMAFAGYLAPRLLERGMKRMILEKFDV
jgi:short-subunit dehydrogenase